MLDAVLPTEVVTGTAGELLATRALACGYFFEGIPALGGGEGFRLHVYRPTNQADFLNECLLLLGPALIATVTRRCLQ
jgi:hypothetical protein